jgi:hypothetical protein
MKLPINEDPTIPGPRPSLSLKKNSTTDLIKDSTDLFKGETQIEKDSISQRQITGPSQSQPEKLIQATSSTIQNHNKTGKTISLTFCLHDFINYKQPHIPTHTCLYSYLHSPPHPPSLSKSVTQARFIGLQGTSMCRRSIHVRRIPYKSGQFFYDFLYVFL